MDTSARLQTYRPVLASERWDAIRPVVHAHVKAHFAERTAAGRKPVTIELALAHLVTFYDWVAETQLVPLDAAALSPGIIDAYTVGRLTEVKPNVAERERKTLRAVAGLAQPREVRKHSTTSPVHTPYDDAERARIHAWASLQPDAARQRNCAVIAALSLGAGLTTGELVAARVGDIRLADDDLPAIAVGGKRARVVPFTFDWADRAAALRVIDDAGAKLLRPGATARDRTLVAETLLTSIGDIKPTPQRLRNTWLVNHLDAGTPLRLLAELAGLKGADAFGRLLPYTRQIHAADSLSLARLRRVTS